MEEYIIKKINFIHQELTALLKACGYPVKYIEYIRCNGDEYIKIDFDDGQSTRKICITAISNVEIAVDVLNVLYYY